MEKIQSGEYNNGKPIDISELSEEKRIIAIKQFSEGSKELEECLLMANERNLKTKACCKGYHGPLKKEWLKYCFSTGSHINKSYEMFSELLCAPYIAFNGYDVLSFLSKDFINNDQIQLEYDEESDTSVVRLYGKNCYKLIEKLTDEIRSGKKNDEKYLKEKLNKNISFDTSLDASLYALRLRGFSTEEIRLFLPFVIAHSFSEVNCLNESMSIDELNERDFDIGDSEFENYNNFMKKVKKAQKNIIDFNNKIIKKNQVKKLDSFYLKIEYSFLFILSLIKYSFSLFNILDSLFLKC